jgi:predicted nucleic acid-binding protein
LILQMVEEGEIDLVVSEVVEYENSRNPVALRRAWMDRCLGLAKCRVAVSHDILNPAKALEAQGIGALDSLHLACADTRGATRFLTRDDRVVERYAGNLKVQNPADYIVSGRGMRPWR